VSTRAARVKRAGGQSSSLDVELEDDAEPLLELLDEPFDELPDELSGDVLLGTAAGRDELAVGVGSGSAGFVVGVGDGVVGVGVGVEPDGFGVLGLLVGLLVGALVGLLVAGEVGVAGGFVGSVVFGGLSLGASGLSGVPRFGPSTVPSIEP
jgi:hypothetical protein